MKISALAAAALCVQFGFAVPHGRHQDLHKRSDFPRQLTLTEVVTVTDVHIVWFDNSGNVVSTEYRTPTASAESVRTTDSVAGALTSTSSTVIITNSKPTPIIVSSISKFQETENRKEEPQSSTHSQDTTTTIAPNTASAKASPNVVGSDRIKAVANTGGFGVAYDAYSGTGGSCRSSLDSDFAFLASKGVRSVRVYDICFAEAVNAATAHGLRLMIGITDYNDFDNHLNALIGGVASTKAGWSVVDTVFIGNEMFSKGVGAGAIADKVLYGRKILNNKGYNGAVVTVDVWVNFLTHPEICNNSDFCAANAHAYFDGGVAAANAGAFVKSAQATVAKAVGGKRVVITESGWPHAGAAINQAFAGIDTQRQAMSSIVTAFTTNPSDIYLFMAYDTKWKTGDEIERNFGIFDAGHYDGHTPF